MPSFFKIRRRKGPKVSSSAPSQNVIPSTSTLTSTEQSDLAIERIDWALDIANIMKDVSEGSPLLAPLKATCALIIRGLEIARSVHQSQSDLHEVAEILEKQKRQMEEFTLKLEGGNNRGSSALQSKLETYLKVIQDAFAETALLSKPSKSERFNFLQRARPTTSTQDDIPSLKQKLNDSYQDFIDAALLIASEKVEERVALAVEMYETLHSVEEATRQEPSEPSVQLEDAPGYDYDSPLALLYGHGLPCCQPGTRTAILADINQWAVDAAAKEKIYWLKDAAGTGKTTVAATCARDWQANHALAGRFFFTPNSEASSGIDRFCTAVAKDMAFLVPSLDSMITSTLSELSRRRCGFYEQFEKLLVKPLKSSNVRNPVILILDALDNCDPDGRKVLLNCMLEHLPGIRDFKVLLTSRPSPDIVSVLSHSTLIKGHDVQLFDIHDDSHTDVRVYIHSTLTRLDDQQREKLVHYSGGLFIVAATACRMLRLSGQPAKLLNKLLHADSKEHLDELYLEVLRQAVWSGGAHEKMMSVLQIIVVAFQPVSINTIAYFLSAKFDVGKFVQDLGAVLKDGHPERPIKVLHPTFREFLEEFDRANGFIINKSSSHALAAIGCLNTLDRLLDYDVLQLTGTYKLFPSNSEVEDMDKKLSTATTAALRYASSYWAYHVASSLENSEVWLKMVHFLTTKVLNLVELMSWRGDLGGCIQGLSQLRVKTLRTLHKKPDSLDKSEAAKIFHAYQFLLQHQPVIQDSALHTYTAALAFTPEGSPLIDGYRRKYADQVPRIISTTPTTWSARDVLTGHTNYVRQLEFSPDGTRLATRAEDCSLILWDTSSGAIVGHSVDDGSRDEVVSLTFSPEGDQLAFAKRSSKIYIWSAINGRQQMPTIDAGPGNMVQIAFSPTHPYIISASTERRDSNWGASNNLRVWSISNGQKVGRTMRLEGGVRRMAVSPDGSRVACVSKRSSEWAAEGMATLWSLETFLQLMEYKMLIVHDIHCVCYSPSGSRFVTWDQNGTLYLRDGVTGEAVNLVKGEESSLRGVYFSPSGNMMASFYGWKNPVIYLWDPDTGVKKLTLSGHSSTISDIWFSQDGLRLASIALDQTLRVWDTTCGDSLESFFSGYTGNVSDPVLSPDWSKLVTVSISNQINVHDVEAGTMHGIDSYEDIDLDLAPPNAAFSPNRDVVVCGYMDLNERSTLGLWSLDTCARVGMPMVGHKGGIVSVAFSGDANYVSSLSGDGTMRLWDAHTGLPIGDPFRMYDGCYTTFSPDSMRVGCCSYTANSIKVWDIHTRANLLHVNRKVTSYRVTFTPDSLRLAAGCGGSICIWDLAAGPSAQPKLSSSSSAEFNQLVFSPTEDLLASSLTSNIRLWKYKDDIQLIAEVSMVPVSGFKLGISFDGKFLAYGSSIWDLSSLPEPPMPLDRQGKDAPSIDWKEFPHSLLTYHNGWIHSGSPWGPLLPIPRHFWDQFRNWDACGQKLVIWTQQRLPIVIDVSPLLS